MRMRNLITGVTAVALLSMAAPAPGAHRVTAGDSKRAAAASGTKAVKMVDDKFKSKSVTIPAGTKVKWVNKGSYSHTTTGTGWDSTVSPGQSFSRKFKKAGTYHYRCSFHSKMTGTVVVTS